MDKGTAFDHAIQDCQGDMLLNAAIHAFVAQCWQLNDDLKHTLWHIYTLPGYTGECEIGEHWEDHPGEQLAETEE